MKKKKLTPREEAKKFNQAQERRQKIEGIGFDGSPRKPNPAMGLPLSGLVTPPYKDSGQPKKSKEPTDGEEA